MFMTSMSSALSSFNHVRCVERGVGTYSKIQRFASSGEKDQAHMCEHALGSGEHSRLD